MRRARRRISFSCVLRPSSRLQLGHLLHELADFGRGDDGLAYLEPSA